MQVSTVKESRNARLIELSNELLTHRNLILASNRGPLEYHVTPEGQLQPRRGSGGVVTALSSLTRSIEFTWIASAMGEGDRHASEEAQGNRITSPLPGQKLLIRYVITPRRVYHKYYNIFCNPLLWFLQHYMWSSPYTPNVDPVVYDAWENGYVPVNQAFAEAIIAEARQSPNLPYVMVHDYHLYLVPSLVRREIPNAIIQQFLHIPWPTPRYWQLLPATFRSAICESLCDCDVVGFQSMWDVRNFLQSCQVFVKNAQVDFATSSVEANGHRTLVRAYPISIDVEEVRHIALSPRAAEYERKIKSLGSEKTIIRVDRAEPSKNIVRGFKAFHLLLSRYPELHGRVKFLAFLVPSRTHIRQYERYQEEINETVKVINASFSREDWQPITVFYENNYTQAIAAMRLYDVLMVNPVIDGMNLVAKEGPVVNTKAGVLILSESAGAYDQLKDGSLGVAPADLEGTMQALYEALTMPMEERERRTTLLVEAIEREDITHWLTRQLEDIRSLV